MTDIGDEITVTYYSSIEEASREEWDSIVKGPYIVNSYDYLRAVELSELENFEFHYLTFHHKKELIAHCPLITFEYNLEIMAGSFMKSLAGRMRKFFPRFFKLRFLECGLATQLGNPITIRDNNYLKPVIEALHMEMERIKKRERCTFSLIRDFPNTVFDDYSHFKKLKYKVFRNLPNTTMYLKQDDFQEYLQSLTHKRRYEVKRRLRAFDDRGCTIELCNDVREYGVEILDLWFNIYNSTKELQREILNREYFEYLSDFLGDRAYTFICKREGKVIAFMMILEGEDRLLPIYCGMDYGESKKSYSYFVMLYKTIEEALKRGKKIIELGITTYTPKIELGMVVEPLNVFSRAKNPFLNLIFAPIMNMTTDFPPFEERKIFNDSHLAEEFAPGDVSALIEGDRYEVTSIDERRVCIWGAGKLQLDKSYGLKVFSSHYAFFAKTKVKSREASRESGFSYELQIEKISNENLPLFSYFKERLGAGKK